MLQVFQSFTLNQNMTVDCVDQSQSSFGVAPTIHIPEIKISLFNNKQVKLMKQLVKVPKLHSS